MTVSERFREIGLAAEESRKTPPRHAVLRDDPAALALRVFRDRGTLTDEEVALLDVPPELLQYRLDFVEHLYLFSDWRGSNAKEVLAPGETTAILYRAARSVRDAERGLDLGCGCGTLALLLAPNVRTMIGTDINPRAVALARLNAAVNGIDNVEFREGSLYDPVADEEFDLIVSQPPYIPQPPGTPRHLFLHGGRRGYELARQIIGRLKGHLTRDGQAFLFSDWPLQQGEQLRDRIASEGLQADLLVSPPLTLEAYERIYEVAATGVRQCLARFTHGDGVSEREVLPHEWSMPAFPLPYAHRASSHQK